MLGPLQPAGVNARLILAIITANAAAILIAIGAMRDPTTTTGDTVYRGADGGIQRLAIGADASVLTSVNGVPTWQPASSGSTPTAGLDTARPAPSLGAIYTGTDTGLRYLGESDGAGGTRWVVMGARWSEGRDTSAVAVSTSGTATSSVTVDSGTAVSGALVFSVPSAPGSASVLASVSTGTGWQLQIGANAANRYATSMFRSGLGTTTVELGEVSASPTTVHAIAWTLSGINTRWSLDGSAAAVASHVSGTATTATTAVRIAANSGGFGATFFAGSLVLWSTSVGDSDLATVSGSARAAGSTPGRIPAVSGATEIVRWHAAGTRTGVVTETAIGTIGGTWTWLAAPSVSVR